MKQNKLLTVLFSTATIMLPSIAGAAITITNVGFENGTPPDALEWGQFGDTDFIVEQQDFAKKSGNYGVWIKGFSDKAGGMFQVGTGTINAGDEYTFSGFFNNETAKAFDKVEIKLEWMGANTQTINDITSGVNGLAANTFTEFSVTGTAPTGVTGLTVSIYVDGSSANGGSLFFDEAKLVQIPEPTSSALLGLGGLALLFRRRK